MTDDARLTRLEETLTHLQRHITEQDKVILALTDDVARLKQQLAVQQARTASAASDDDMPVDERPPHY